MRPANPITTNNSTEQIAPLRVLLVEPDLEVLADRSLLLSRSNYTVAPASGYREIFGLHSEIGFRLAVLNDNLGELALRAAAEFVRRQWPSARILILGNAQAALEDYLYDEVVNHQIQSKELLDTLARLSEDSWSLRSRLLGFRPRTSACNEERVTSHQSTPSESNPKKAANDKLVEDEREAPARALRIPR
jgi:hypothetical protein